MDGGDEPVGGNARRTDKKKKRKDKKGKEKKGRKERTEKKERKRRKEAEKGKKRKEKKEKMTCAGAFFFLRFCLCFRFFFCPLTMDRGAENQNWKERASND